MAKNSRDGSTPGHYHDSESSDTLLSEPDREHEKGCTCEASRPWRTSRLVPWLLSMVLAISLAVATLRRSVDCTHHSFWRPYELKAATRDLPETYHDVQFDAALRYNESHLLYRPTTNPPYVGDPSPEIDAAWEGLIGSVDVFVTPKEREEMDVDLWLDPQTSLHVGLLSVMHDLHCVSMIRMSLYPDYYPKMRHYTTKNHVEHCLDMLRLSLMCTGDMTLIPTKDSDSRPFEAVFDTVHACRDFSTIKQWSLDRDSANPERYPVNAEKLKLKMGIS